MPDGTSALHLVLTADPSLVSIVRLSLAVSLTAVVVAALIGLPLGALIALTKFRSREFVIVVLNALMGLPPVIVGLLVYLSLSRSGPLGSWGWLFTAKAMVIAQAILVLPILAALTRQTIEDLWVEYRDEFAAMNVGALGRIRALLWDARFSLITALLAGFGRAAAEVGAIIIVGGFYAHDDDRHCTGDFQGKPPSRPRTGNRSDRYSYHCQRRSLASATRR